MKIYYWICSPYNLSYLETSLCGWLLQIVIPHNYNIYIKINWVFGVRLNQCILLGLASDHASSTQLIFYKHVHICIFIKQFRLSSVVKNVLSFLRPTTFYYFRSRLLFLTWYFLHQLWTFSLIFILSLPWVFRSL